MGRIFDVSVGSLLRAEDLDAMNSGVNAGQPVDRDR